MSVSKAGGGSSAPKPSPPPKPAAPAASSSSSAAKPSTPAATPASTSSASTGTGSSSTGSSSSTSSASSSSSTTDKSKSTTDSTSSTSKTEDEKSTSSVTDTEDKFEKSKETDKSDKDEKKTKENFNDRFIKNLRQNFEPESTDVKDKVGEVEQTLAKDKFSAVEGKDAIKQLESTAADMKAGEKKDKLQARVDELKKEVAERERAEEKAKAAAARDAKDNQKSSVGKNEETNKVEEAGGVEGDVKSKLNEERQRLAEPEDDNGPQPTREASAEDKPVGQADKDDPETKQIAKQRQLEEAEEDARQRLADFKENKNDKALGEIQSAYDSAIANKEKTIQSFEQELSGFYPADKAKELAQQAISSKEDFYSTFGSLHSLGDAGSREGMAKLNPEAAKLFPQENSVSAGAPEEQLNRAKDGLQNGVATSGGEPSAAVSDGVVSELRGSVADRADARDSEMRNRVRDLKDTREAEEQNSPGVLNQAEDKVDRLKEKEEKLGGAAGAEKAVEGLAQGEVGSSKADKEVADKSKAVEGDADETKSKDKVEQLEAEEAKAAEVKDGAKPTREVSAEVEKAPKPAEKSEEKLQAVQLEAASDSLPQADKVSPVEAKSETVEGKIGAEIGVVKNEQKAKELEPEAAQVEDGTKPTEEASANKKKEDQTAKTDLAEDGKKPTKEVSAEAEKAPKLAEKSEEKLKSDQLEAASDSLPRADKARPVETESVGEQKLAADDVGKLDKVKELQPTATAEQAGKSEKGLAKKSEGTEEIAGTFEEKAKTKGELLKKLESKQEPEGVSEEKAKNKGELLKKVDGETEPAVADKLESTEELKKAKLDETGAAVAGALGEGVGKMVAKGSELLSKATGEIASKVTDAVGGLFGGKDVKAEGLGKLGEEGKLQRIDAGEQMASPSLKKGEAKPLDPEAFQKSVKERVQKDPEQFRKQLEEAYPKADQAKIDGLMKQAEAGKFPAEDQKLLSKSEKSEKSQLAEKLDGAAEKSKIADAVKSKEALQESAKKDPEQFRKQLEEAYPDADKTKIDGLMKQAEEGKLSDSEVEKLSAKSEQTEGIESADDTERTAQSDRAEGTEESTGAEETRTPSETDGAPTTDIDDVEEPEVAPTEELTDGQRALQASREEARARLNEYQENGDTEALESIDKAYDAAKEDPDRARGVLERELAKVYPEDKAREMADKAMESKEDYYEQYSSLHRNATDERAKGALERSNPEAAALAQKEQQQRLPDAATQTREERVEGTRQAIQDEFKQRATSDPEQFRRQIEEAYPDADKAKIDDLIKKAEEGNFPVPENIRFVAEGDDALGSQKSKFDGENNELILSEALLHNQAEFRNAIVDGAGDSLDKEMGFDRSTLASLGFDLRGENSLGGSKLMSQVRDNVAARTSDEAVARTKAFEELNANPENKQATQDFMQREMEEAFGSGRWGARQAREAGMSQEEWARQRSTDLAAAAMRDPESFDAIYNEMYRRGDAERRERLKELNPTAAALAEERLRELTPEQQALAVGETAAANAYDRYRDANSEGPHLDPLSDISKGFERAQRENGQATVETLKRFYQRRGMGAEDALKKAQEAMASEKGLYSQFSALYNSTGERGKEHLRRLNPELAGLLDREKAGQLKTDDQWRQDVRDSYKNVPFVGDWMANNAIAKVENKLTTTSQSDQQRGLASAFQGAIKDRATEDPQKFAQDLRTAFPKADDATIDRLVGLARDGNFPLAQNVSFVDKDDPLLNGKNASYDSQNGSIYIDKELLNDPSKVLSAYVEENGHHLDKLLGGGDSTGDEGEQFQASVLQSGGMTFLDQSRAKLEDDYAIVIGDDGKVRVIENQAPPVVPPPVVNPPNPGPVVNPGQGGTTPIGGGTTPIGPGTNPIGGGTGIANPGGNHSLPFEPGTNPGGNESAPVGPPRGGIDPTKGPGNAGRDIFNPSPQPDPISNRPDPVRQEPVSPRPSEPIRDFKPPRIETPEPPRQSNEARENREGKEFKANFDPNDIRNLDELRRLDDAMAKLKDLPQALDQLDKLKEALKGGKGLGDSLSELKNLTQTMDSLKGLASNLDSLERLGKLQHELKDLPNKLSKMDTLPSALETLGNLNKSMSDLQKLPKMLDQLKDLPRQMSQLEQLPNTLNKFNKLPDNINDLGRLSGFLDSARQVPGKQIRANDARVVAADRILSGKVAGPTALKGGKPGPKLPGNGAQVTGPSGTETGGKAGRIAGGGSTVPYVGRFGGSAPGLGPSIGHDASRQTQARPGSNQASRAVSKAQGVAKPSVTGPAAFAKGAAKPGAAPAGPKFGSVAPGSGTTGGPAKPGLPAFGKSGIAKPGAVGPGSVGAPRPGLATPKPAGPTNPGLLGTKPGLPSTPGKPGPTPGKIAGPTTGVGPRLSGAPGASTPRPPSVKPGLPLGTSSPVAPKPSSPQGAGPAAGAAGTGLPSAANGPARPGVAAPPPSSVPAEEFQQLSQRLNNAGSRPESNSLSRLQQMLSGPGDGSRQLPSVLKSLETLPQNMSSVSRLNGLLGKKDGLAQGIAGLKGLAETAKASAGKMQSLDGLSSLLRNVQESPDAYKGLKRMPGLMNHMGGVQGENPESMAKLLQTVAKRPDALEGLKNFQNLMNTLQKPEMARSLDQLNKMVQSGQLEKLAQSGQKLAMDLQKPQAVFGLDKLESMFFKARANPEAMKGLDRLDQMLSGRDRQGAAIGVDRLGSLLQTAKSQPSMMRQIVERVVQPSSGQPATGQTTTAKQSAPGQGPAVADPGVAMADRRGVAPDRRAGDRRVGAAGGVGAASAATSAGGAGGPKGPGRLRDYREVFNMLSEVGQGIPSADKHPAKLAEMSKGTQGAHTVADAMEAQVVAKPERMLETLKGMTRDSESRQAFGKTLSNMAEATPDRLVGILLLTSDIAGGRQALANTFNQLAADPESAGSVGQTIGSATRTEVGAAGMKELLTNMMATDESGDYTKATQTAETFANASRSKAGAKGLAEGLSNLTNMVGGARDVGGMIRQMSRTKAGAQATGEMLMNMASDRAGAKDLGRTLAAASKSTHGGRDILASFAKMAQTDAGRNDVSRLMVRLTESEHGAKMLSHMAKDKSNAKGLASLLNQVSESPQAAARMNFALERAMHNPKARTEMEVFRGRMASDPGLREAVDRMTSAPTQSQPLQLSQSAKGADAMARLTAFENLARTIGERPVEPPVRQVEQAGSSPSGGTTDGSQSSGQQGTDQQRPFPNQTQPYPDLAAVSDVWRTQSLKTENTGERMAEQAQGSAAAEGESGDTRAKEGQPKSAFRPGDVYSELTLLRARICGDCGFRTSSSGRCARCGFELMQASKPTQPA